LPRAAQSSPSRDRFFDPVNSCLRLTSSLCPPTHTTPKIAIQVDAGNTAVYTYDGEGHRASKDDTGSVNSGGNVPDPSGTTEFVYDPQGHLVHTEAPNTGTGWRGEVFAGNRHLASYANGNLIFAHSDWLGTERNRDLPDPNNPQYPSNQNITSLPFGDWLDNTLGIPNNDWTPLNFTGQYHDFETDLDYFGARYYASTTGRFMTPDPANAGAALDAPQSWNAYSYVLNNPLNLIDRDGLDCIYVNNDTGEYQGFNKGDCDNSTEERANSGYYVNGDVVQSSIAFSGGDANRVFYTFTNDRTVGPQYGNQCVGNCSNADTTVSVSAPLPPGTPTMSADTGLLTPFQRSLLPPPQKPLTTSQLRQIQGCMAFMDPELAGPMFASSAPTYPPSDSTKETEGQKAAQVTSRSEPQTYRNGKPVTPNITGSKRAGPVVAGVGAFSMLAGVGPCAQNAASQ
jgi:RHS repeat-associated protein